MYTLSQCPHPLNLIRSFPHPFNHFEIQFDWKFAGKLRKTTANKSQKREVSELNAAEESTNRIGNWESAADKMGTNKQTIVELPHKRRYGHTDTNGYGYRYRYRYFSTPFPTRRRLSKARVWKLSARVEFN